MKDFETKIRNLIKANKMSIEDFAIKIGITKQNFYLILKRNDLNVSYLEKMSSILDVPITYFFTDDDIIPNNETQTDIADEKDKKIKYLRKKNKRFRRKRKNLV